MLILTSYMKHAAWIYGRTLAGIVVSNPTSAMDVCYQVEVSVSDRSFVQRSPDEGDVSSECRRKALMRLGHRNGECAVRNQKLRNCSDGVEVNAFHGTRKFLDFIQKSVSLNSILNLLVPEYIFLNFSTTCI